jgi:general secretion pathway protein D
MKFIKSTLLLFGILLTLHVTLYAAASADKKALYVGDDREQINVALQNMNIDDFVKMVAKIINKNILVSQSIPGTVNLVSNAPVFKDEILNILIAVLDTKGFTLVEDRGFLKIVRTAQAVQSNLSIVSKSQSLMHTVPLVCKNSDVDATAARIRQFASPSGKIVTIKETNTMLVSDFPENIERIKEIARIIDQEASTQIEAEFIALRNAKASKILEDLNKISKSIINQVGPNNKVEILKDDGTNSIIIVASKENLEKLKEYVIKFDTKNSQVVKTKIFPLKNSESKTTLATLSEIISKQKYADETLKPMASANEEMNAIILSAIEIDMENISKIIESLDVERPQVYVKARIVEISENDSKKIGVKYGLEGGKSNSSGLYTFLMNTGGSSVALSSSLSGVINVGELQEGLALGAMIDFLAGEGAATILSDPSLLCVNNKESSIYVGQTQSVLTSTTQGTSTTELARSSYTRQDIGLTLKIKPRLSASDLVTLAVQVTSEDVISGSGTGLPTTTKRDVKTSAIVKSGESVIIGGLIKSKTSEAVSKIPLLGDIPLFGELFRNTDTTNDKVNLVIMLTPYVVEKSSDLQKLREKLSELDTIQSRYKTSLIEQIKADAPEAEEIKPASDAN